MEKIKGILEDLEKNNDIKIIFACEAGSRAWNLDSIDSDYDIRFVYVRNNPRSYLSLKKLKDVIDGFSDDRLYDWQGWDITKSLDLLYKTNPSIIEWIYSPIVYLKDVSRGGVDLAGSARALLEKQNKTQPLFYHYQSMAKSNYKQHIEKKQKVNIKKYLYVIRPAGMVVWLLKCKNQDGSGKYLEIDFNRVLEEIRPHMSEECHKQIVEIIEIKKSMKEVDESERIKPIDEWIEQVLSMRLDAFKNMSELATDGDLTPQAGEILEGYDDLLHSILNVKFDNK